MATAWSRDHPSDGANRMQAPIQGLTESGLDRRNYPVARRAERPATAGGQRGARRGLCACGHIQLFEKMVDVVLDGGFGDIELLSDFLVRLPLADTVEHFSLAARQGLGLEGPSLAALGDTAEQLRGDSRRTYEFRSCDALDRRHEIVDGRVGRDESGSPRFGTFDDIRQRFPRRRTPEPCSPGASARRSRISSRLSRVATSTRTTSGRSCGTCSRASARLAHVPTTTSRGQVERLSANPSR